MHIEPYLFFEGRADEAIAFYQRALGAQLVSRMRYSDGPPGGQNCPDGSAPPGEAVMHASLQVGGTLLMLSDGFARGQPEFKGVALSLTAKDDAEARRLFDGLADGGQVQQPLEPTFFATSFGMLTDRFGVMWMVFTPKTS
jgi:PhnB protein